MAKCWSVVSTAKPRGTGFDRSFGVKRRASIDITLRCYESMIPGEKAFAFELVLAVCLLTTQNIERCRSECASKRACLLPAAIGCNALE